MSTAIVVGTTSVFFVPSQQAITFTPGGSGKVFVTIDSGNRPHARTGPILAATAVTIPAGATVYATAVGSNGTYSDVSAGGGGGAAAFTDLSDAPATIVAKSITVGNAAGNALVMPAWLQVTDTGRSFVQKTEDVDGGDFNVTSDSGNGATQIYADDTYVKLDAHVNAGDGTVAAGYRIGVYNGVVTLTLLSGAKLVIENLQTSDPALAGAAYWNSDVLTRSTG